MKACVSGSHIHQCCGEGRCGLSGLPHLLCVPVPHYAEALAAAAEEAAAPGTEETTGRDGAEGGGRAGVRLG